MSVGVILSSSIGPVSGAVLAPLVAVGIVLPKIFPLGKGTLLVLPV